MHSAFYAVYFALGDTRRGFGMKIDGACHCGHIAYEAQVDPNLVGVCHCTDCQIMSGSAFSTVVFAPKGGFKLLKGAPKLYFRKSDRGVDRAIAFCPECGTRIYATEAKEPTIYSIRAGTARQRTELVPKIQIWCRSALPWVWNIGGLPKVAEQPPLPTPNVGP